METNTVIERLADEMHSIWANWTTYLVCKLKPKLTTVRLPEDFEAMPEADACLQRWARQIRTPYADLSEKEKDSDREIARRILHAMGWEWREGEPPEGFDRVLVWMESHGVVMGRHKEDWVIAEAPLVKESPWSPDWLWMSLPPPPIPKKEG